MTYGRSLTRGTTSFSPMPDRAALGVGQQALVVGDGGADGDAGALVDVGAAAREPADLGDDLLHVLRHGDLEVVVLEAHALLVHDADLVLDRARVVGADLDAVAVLQRRDDAAAVGVVLRVGARDEEDVERQADAIAADLDVALFHDVEQADLDALGQVGQLVDREDAAVGARDQAVVDRQLVGEVAALGDADRVDLADQVGDRDVGRRELLAVAAVAADPVDRRVVALLGDQVLAVLRDRR